MKGASFDGLTRRIARRLSRRRVLAGIGGAALGWVGLRHTRAQGGPCTLVELRPGYPGYRGFVTGLYGPGEAACLEDLGEVGFDPATEDAENQAAADRLGLAGDPSVWVWENWLAIEAERGLPLTCYLGAYGAMSQGTRYLPAAVAEDDARLLVGVIDGTSLLGRAAALSGVSYGMLADRFVTDYTLRAVAWVWSGRQHANAVDIDGAVLSVIVLHHAWRRSPVHRRSHPFAGGLRSGSRLGLSGRSNLPGDHDHAHVAA